jgi:hypothetical protein
MADLSYLQVAEEVSVNRTSTTDVRSPPGKCDYSLIRLSVMHSHVSGGNFIWCNQAGGKKTFLKARLQLANIRGAPGMGCPIATPVPLEDAASIRVTSVSLYLAAIQEYKEKHAGK